jgi:tRNA A58 N-methylase Trm61
VVGLSIAPRAASGSHLSDGLDRVVAALGDRTFPFALELDAGAGLLSERLAPRCGRLITLERSHTAAAVASRRLRRFPNVDVRVGAELPQWTFDLVVWLAPHDPDHVEAVERVMPRGATLVTAAPALLEPRAALVRRSSHGVPPWRIERFERRLVVEA